jgi:hypothetical protein
MIIPVCIDQIYNEQLNKGKKEKLDSFLNTHPSFSDTLISLDSRQIKINFQNDFKIIFATKDKMKLNINQLLALAITSEILFE